MFEYLLIGAFVFFLYRLITSIGKTFPLFELTAVLYIVQYGIAPLLDYKYNTMEGMSLPKEEYLPFAVMGSLAFIFGLFIFKPKINLKGIKINPELASKLGRIFFTIGIGSSIAMIVLPESLRSIVNFFIILKLPGVYSLVFSDKKIDKVFIFVVFLETAISAILNALLIEFIVFSLFLTMYLSLRYRISNKLKVSIATIGVVFLTVYQGVKADYRKLVWENEVTFAEKIGLLSELITFESVKEAFTADIGNNESVIETIHRLNQGWQTSMAMRQVPAVVPFAEGEALVDDIISSIMPRFLYADKRVVNDFQRFNYYTGYSLNNKTAMTIGVLGDFYINFGAYVSLLFLFLFGAIFSRISLWFYNQFIVVNPLNLIWLPFLFSYLIRPGNEFYMVLNHLIKALIIFYIVRKLVYPVLMNNFDYAEKFERSH